MDLQQAIDSAPAGSTITIPRGVYENPLFIEKSLTLRGEGPGKSILDVKGRGACVLINGAEVDVTLIGLGLKNGASPEGGCIAFRGRSLTVEDSLLEGGASKMYGGGGARLLGARARLVRTRITKCLGQQGGGLLADDACEVELIGCVLTGNTAVHGGGLRVKEGARVRLVHCTVADNQATGTNALGDEILISGTLTRTPELQVINSIVAPRAPNTPPIASLGQFPGKLVASHCLFPSGAKSLVPEGPGLVFAPPEFMPQGQHRLALSPTSPAVGSADPNATPPSLTDLLGNAFGRGGRSDIGAYSV